MGKVVKSVMGPIAGLIIGGKKGFVQGLGNVITAYVGGPAMVAAAIGSSLLTPTARAPKMSGANGDRLAVSINLREPRKAVFGTTAFNTDLRDQEYSADQAYLHAFIVNASHRVSAFREIWFNDKLAWTAAGGVQGEFTNYLTVTPILEGSPANAINIGPRMGSSRRFTGCAYVHLRYKLTGNDKKSESPFAQSVPSRMTIIGDGMPVYDPRLDSTVGGSGPQRANDQTTWAWSSSAGRNPALQLLTWMLGWRIQNPSTGAWKLAIGKGVAPARINIGSFITAANICDEQVARSAGGFEPRYRADGVLSEADGLEQVADIFKSSMNATLDDVDGQFRLGILHNDLAAPIGELQTSDLLGTFKWNPTPALQNTVNVIRGGYTDPSTASLYQLIDYPEVRIASPDGIERPQTVNLAMVQSPSQAQRLIKLRLQRAIYPGTFSATFQATAWKFTKGDVICLTVAQLGFDRKLFRIVDNVIQVDGTVPLVLREEHADIYLADNDDAALVVPAAPTTYNPLLSPIVQGIGEAGETALWDGITGPGKAADNATNSGDPDSPFGPGGTVGEAAALIAAAKARQDALENVTIPAIDEATRLANERIDAARQLIADEKARAEGKEGQLDQRIDAVVANGTYDDTAVKASIEEVRSAYVDADIGFAERSALIEATMNTGEGAAINANSKFAAWPIPASLPTFWDFWGTPPSVNRGGTENGASGFSVPILGNGAGAPDGGIRTTQLSLSAGWYVIEAEVYLASGDYQAAGVTWRGQLNLSFAVEPDGNGVVSATGPARRKFSKLIHLDADNAGTLHAMNVWSGWGQQHTAKSIYWNRCAIRPASDAEVKAGKVFNTLLPDIAARVSSSEDALADLPNHYATAQRASNIEAYVGPFGGRIGSLETVTGNGTFATAARAEQIASYAQGVEAKVDIQAGTIAGLGTRQAAYWRVLAVAGNNRAQLTVSADANGGAGIDIVGDVSIAGNLLVSGSIVTDKIGLNQINGIYNLLSPSRTIPFSATIFAPVVGLGVTVPNPSGSTIRVDCSTTAMVPFGYVPPGGAAPPNLFYSVWRVQNGTSTLVRNWEIATFYTLDRLTLISDIPAAGSPATYQYRYYFDSNPSGSLTFGIEQMFVHDIKR